MKVQLDPARPAMHCFAEIMKWWRWRAEFTLLVLQHPSFRQDSTATQLLDLDSPKIRELYDLDVSVEDAYRTYSQEMQKYGW